MSVQNNNDSSLFGTRRCTAYSASLILLLRLLKKQNSQEEINFFFVENTNQEAEYDRKLNNQSGEKGDSNPASTQLHLCAATPPAQLKALGKIRAECKQVVGNAVHCPHRDTSRRGDIQFGMKQRCVQW